MPKKNQKKRRKKAPGIAAKQAMDARVGRARQHHAPTPNAKIIRDLMITQKIRGGFKDYVVIVGKRIVDWQGSYDMVTENGQTVGVKNMALVHKSKLHNIVGAELAARFWRPGIGRRNTEKST